MIQKRARYHSLEPSKEPTWLLVENQYAELVFAKEHPPLANRIHIMIEALAASVAKGWEVECLPGEYPLYFCHKGQYRHCIHIGTTPAADRMSAYLRRRASALHSLNPRSRRRQNCLYNRVDCHPACQSLAYWLNIHLVRGDAMPESNDLIDRSIADLEQLATEFATELEVARPVPGKTLRHLRRKEALLTISILLPKLAAVRRLEPDLPGAMRSYQGCGDE